MHYGITNILLLLFSREKHGITVPWHLFISKGELFFWGGGDKQTTLTTITRFKINKDNIYK